MNNITAARVLLRQSVKLSQTGRIYNVAQHSTRPILCQSCRRPVLEAPTSTPSQQEARAFFHASPVVHKKKKTERGGKGGSKEGASGAADEAEAAQPVVDVMDFSEAEQRLAKHAEYFKDTLKKLQAGGRFSPEALGALRVTVDRKAGTAYPLRELAQVVPRGPRAVSLLAHERAYVKPIMSAVQNSDAFNQQPQRGGGSGGADADADDLELKLRVEPELPADVVRRAKAVAHDWRERIRFVRQARVQRLNDMRHKGQLLIDTKRLAEKKLTKIINAALAEVDVAEKAAVDAAEKK